MKKFISNSLMITFFIMMVVSQKNPHFLKNRSTIVHLFEWKWTDIADECERFLQHKGYGGVQISPPSENLIISGRSWSERYQPVSYNIITRSGDLNEFINMTKRCNAVGIRIYADTVINHMTAKSGNGTGGNIVNINTKSYPAVPYTKFNFHNDCIVDDYQDVYNVKNCELDGLLDLDQTVEYTAEKIIHYMNNLIDYGVAGFRIDAAKHMWPEDLEYIYSNLNNLNPEFGFPNNSVPFIYQEVIDLGGEPIKSTQYTGLGRVIEFKYSYDLGNVFHGNDKLTYLENWGTGWGLINGSDAIAFIDNHDNQRSENSNVLTYKEPKQYKMAIAFMLAHPYGVTRIISSYYFNNTEQGPPADENENIISPGINEDDTCYNGWVCEHRWRQIYDMVDFRNIVEGTNISNWWSNGDQQIAFCRGDRGFIAFTNSGDIDESLQTCLEEGTYCDIISGKLEDGECTGKAITVDSDGYAQITIKFSDEDGVLAIHVNSKQNSSIFSVIQI